MKHTPLIRHSLLSQLRERREAVKNLRETQKHPVIENIINLDIVWD